MIIFYCMELLARTKKCLRFVFPLSVPPSIRPHGITRLPLEGSDYFSKTYGENSILIKIRQE